MMNKIPVCLVALALAATPAQASKKGWSDVSDVGVYSLMAVSVGLPIAKKDTNGALQAAGSLAATSLVTEGLKQAFPELRPDGSDRKSFPSGHTSRAFTAAATLWNRQGKGVGIPAMAVATLVGVARVEADKHHWYDCVVGAGIGLTSGFLITRERPDRESALIPWGDSKGGGLTFVTRF